jgi:uncharacterized lipoprotein YehR (DUF1307 family)
MKKIVSSLLILCMTVALVGCGGKEQTVTYQNETTDSGLTVTETMTMEAKGDKIQKITQSFKVDMSGFDASQQTLLVEAYDALAEQYNSVEGASATGSSSDGSYSLDVTIDTTGDAVSQLAELGILEVDGNAKGISLKKTVAGLEASGYTLVE